MNFVRTVFASGRFIINMADNFSETDILHLIHPCAPHVRCTSYKKEKKN